MEWRQIPSFPHYAVDESGNVKRIAPGICNGKPGKIMKPYRRSDGYNMFILRRDGKSFYRKAHQLVAETFIGPKPFANAEVCHNDGSRTNDHVSNLRWDTRKGNQADKKIHGTLILGSKHARARLTERDVLEIRRRADNGESHAIIGKDYNMIQPNISRIVRREQWKHV